MRPTGAPDPLYLEARRLLLDVLEALGPQRDAVILVGAQAIYLRTAGDETAVAEFTRDADLAIDPTLLKHAPALSEVMRGLGFEIEEPGIWTKAGSEVDFIVPDAVASKAGRRAARLMDPHGKETARKTRGVEGALLDNGPMTITALNSSDDREIPVRVAGPTALLVAKLHKIGDRKGNPDRLANKDAFDIFRLLRATPADVFNAKMEILLRGKPTRAVTEEAIGFLNELFSTPGSLGARMAAAAAVPFENPEEIANACAALAGELTVGRGGPA